MKTVDALKVLPPQMVVSMPVGELLQLVDAAAEGGVFHWLKVPEAAKKIGMPPSTLRNACARWHNMENPPVRVRRASDAPTSDWLIIDVDLEKIPRRRRGRPPKTPVAAEGVDAAEDPVAYWGDRVRQPRTR